MKLSKVSSLGYQKHLFDPLFVFFSARSSTMHLEKSLNWAKNLAFSPSAENFRQLL